MAFVRKNQKNLTQAEWDRFVQAVNKMHGVNAAGPAYREFVAVHVQAMSPSGMSWAVHTMGPTMPGRNFLAWHRQFLVEFEKRLGVPIPYWDWMIERSIPGALDTPPLLASWSVRRNWDASLLPSSAAYEYTMSRSGFRSFQRRLETVLHNEVHLAVGGDPEVVPPSKLGDMSTEHSPADPIFWLHHSNVDRLWALWFQQHSTKVPTNLKEVLQPDRGPGLNFAVKVGDLLDISTLGYSYQ
jgi:tyrosinase